MPKGEKGDSSRSFRIFETKEFADQLEDLAGKAKAQVAKKLQEYVYPQLKEQPYFGTNIKKLRGYSPETWRYRIGDFRIFYEIDEAGKVVALITLSDRKDSY